MDEQFYNRVSNDRIGSRQIDELIGIARGVAADGRLNQTEVEFLQTWLAANMSISNQPLVRTLYQRVNDVLSDGIADAEECAMLIETLNAFSNRNIGLGEVLKSTTLPLCEPAPALSFEGKLYCFTGTFNYGQRKHCEQAVVTRGASCGGLSRNTDYLVIGIYATESWKHSSFGNKIIKASEWRDRGLSIALVSETYWASHL